MFKQCIAIIVLSIAIILTMTYCQIGLNAIIQAHHWVSEMLMEVFSGGQAGNLIRNLLALLAIPVGVALIPVIIFWLTKRRWFPYFMHVVWVIWLVQTAVLVIQYKIAA